MKTRQPHTQAEPTYSAAPSTSQPRQAQQESPNADAIAHGPRMTAQRRALRAAFGAHAASAQLQVDADQQLLDDRPAPLGTTAQMAGMEVNDDVRLEGGADWMGEKAESGRWQLVRDGKNQDTKTGQTSSMPGNTDKPRVAQQKPARVGTDAATGMPVLQRLAVYSGSNPPTDVNIVMTLPDMMASVGGPCVHSSAVGQYGEHKTIGLLAHGSKGRITWGGASLTGKALVDDHLAAGEKPIDPESVLEIWSCAAGTRSEQANDSLVDDVKAALTAKDRSGVTVKGVRGKHIVLNGGRGHYKPKDGLPAETTNDALTKLRLHYLCLTGFLSKNLVKKSLGGLRGDTAGIGAIKQKVSVPADAKKTDELLRDLQGLHKEEITSGSALGKLAFAEYIKHATKAWDAMCAKLSGDRIFAEATEKVDADWLTL